MILSPISRMTEETLSLMVEKSPGIFCDKPSIPPLKRFCMPISTALMPVVLLMAPCSAIFIAVGMSIPMASARNFQAGTPASASWSISSPETLPLACICPIASVIRSMPSCPIPSIAAASPMAAIMGMMSCAAKPNANNFLDELTRPGSWNGVSAANFAKLLRNFSACPLSPIKVVKAFLLACISPAILMLARPKTPIAAAAAAKPETMFSDISMASEPRPLRIARFVLSHFFRKSELSPPMIIVIAAFPAMVSPHFRYQFGFHLFRCFVSAFFLGWFNA
ncbi:hypothetical protein SpAn4DRAFT_4327 [Sporomusa ovata]|uniref:Uncharacterized protein n=1 Tax=Sporomusa ovata TaxID=2378 RepID=A0A0U1L751_9FIRM|nr:hypothetical protein SpAn4DRAFT_4327 [Sporomusa ovata]